MGLITVHLYGDRADLDAMVGFLLNTEPVVKHPRLVHKSNYHPITSKFFEYLCYMDFLIGEEQVAPAATPNPSMLTLEDLPME